MFDGDILDCHEDISVDPLKSVCKYRASSTRRNLVRQDMEGGDGRWRV